MTNEQRKAKEERVFLLATEATAAEFAAAAKAACDEAEVSASHDASRAAAAAALLAHEAAGRAHKWGYKTQEALRASKSAQRAGRSANAAYVAAFGEHPTPQSAACTEYGGEGNDPIGDHEAAVVELLPFPE